MRKPDGTLYVPPLRGRDRIQALNPRRAIARVIIDLTTIPGSRGVNYGEPRGDPGLFGPDSRVWLVHEDFPSMLCGGVASLLLQAMHPRALAGVWDHSNFREDLLGRLRRTTHFVAATTYAPTADALRMIKRVKDIHESVTGATPAGEPYAAADPDLLTWVHTAEVYSFLRAYRRYRNSSFSAVDQDAYYREVSRVAFELGATDVPRSREQVHDYFRAMQPELEWGERQREILRILLQAPAPRRGLEPAVRLFIHGGMDLLPDWAQAHIGVGKMQQWSEPARRLLLHVSARPLRWGLRGTLADFARRRVAAGSGEQGQQGVGHGTNKRPGHAAADDHQ